MQSRTRSFALFALALAALAGILPLILWGAPAGAHDLELHIAYLRDLKSALAAGDFYPRWLPSLNEGQGSPIFLIQYPLPYYMLAALDWLTGSERWTIAAFTFVWLFLSGYWFHLWLVPKLGAFPALAGGLTYMALPFHLANCTYVRWGIGELVGVAVLPLLLILVRRPAGPLGGLAPPILAASLLLLSHLPTILIGVPLCVLALLLEKNSSAALRLAGAVAGALLLCAKYVVQVLVHRQSLMKNEIVDYQSLYIFFDNRFFDILEKGIALFPGGPPLVDLLREALVYEPHVRDNAVWPALHALCFAWVMIIAAAVTLALRRKWDRLSLAMLVGAGLSTFLTLPWSHFILTVAPAIKTLQFPLRFLIIQSFCTAVLCAMALRGTGGRIWQISAVAVFSAVLLAGNAMMVSRMDFSQTFGAARVDTMYSAYGGVRSSLALSRGVAPMAPIPYARDEQGRQLFNLFCYPGWQISRSGENWTPAHQDTATGLCAVQPGAASYKFRFEPLPVERAGGFVSMIAAAALSIFYLMERRARLRQAQLPI